MVGGVLTAIALVLACLGAGRAVIATERVPTNPPLADAVMGLTGLALLTALGGWLVLAGVYSETAGRVLLAGGGLALVLGFSRGRLAGERRASRPLPIAAIVLGLLTLTLALGRAFGELVVPFVEPWDDWLSYWHFPRLMLESGGFIEPFNLRRLTALGAAPFVQSFFWPSFGIAANGMTDAILGQLLLWAVVRALPGALSARPEPPWLGEALALGALIVSLTIPSGSSQPTLLPMAGALVLILLTQRLTTGSNGSGGFRTAVAWGLVAAWLIGLRTSNVVFPAGLWLVSAVIAARQRDPQSGIRLATAALATTISLLPWCLALWRSSATPLYPLIAGNYRFDGGLYSIPLDWPSLIALIGDRLWMSRVWIIAALGALAALRPRGRLLYLQVVMALVLLIALSAATTTGLDAITIHRLNAPFLAAGIVFLTAAVIVGEPTTTDPGHIAPRWDLRPLVLWALLVLWFQMPITLPPDAWPIPASNRSMFQYQGMQRINAAVGSWLLGGKTEVFHAEEYAAAQARLPADARLASAAGRPYLFRFDRQVVHTLDFVGAVSPTPGMPFFKGPEALARYLRDLGYTHLAFSPPVLDDTSKPSEEFANPMVNIQSLRRYGSDFTENTVRLESAYSVIYASPELVVMDIRKPR